MGLEYDAQQAKGASDAYAFLYVHRLALWGDRTLGLEAELSSDGCAWWGMKWKAMACACNLLAGMLTACLPRLLQPRQQGILSLPLNSLCVTCC
jgi:hypothetical protein